MISSTDRLEDRLHDGERVVGGVERRPRSLWIFPFVILVLFLGDWLAHLLFPAPSASDSFYRLVLEPVFLVLFCFIPLYWFAHKPLIREIERRQASETALRAERNFNQTILATIGNPVVVLEVDGSIHLFNAVCERLTGYGVSEVKGKKLWDFLIPEADIEEVRRLFSSLVAGQFPNTHENDWLTRDGEVRRIVWYDTVILDDDGSIRFIVGAGLDVTEQRREGARHIYQQRCRQAIHNLLQTALEPVSLQEQLTTALEEILVTPCLNVLSKGSIFLLDEKKGVLELAVQRGMSAVQQSACRQIPLGHCLCGRAAQSGEVIYAASVDEDHDIRFEGMEEHGHYCVPIISQQRLLGVINAYLPEHQQKNAEEIEFLLTIANTLAGIIERRRVDDQLRASLDAAEAVSEGLRRVLFDRERAEKRLKESEARFRSVTQSIIDAIVSTDEEGKVIFWNRGAETIFGYREEEILGKPVERLIPRRYQAFHRKGLERVRTTGESRLFGQRLELSGQRKNGDPFPMEMSLSTWKSGEELFFSAVIQDLTERKNSQEELHFRTYHDLLTRLPNRTLFRDRLQQALIQAQRSQHKVGVLLFDLDLFKKINDSLGHAAGDRLLREVANRTRGCLRDGDTVCRFGGDAFAILIDAMGGERDAVRVVGKLFDVFTRPFDLHGETIHLTASIGITIFPDDGVNADSLIRNAESALKRAKDTGRNNFQFFTREMDAQALTRLTLENRLRKAIEDQEFQVYYQPKIHAVSGRITGMEALVRWEHPEQGIVSPQEFIPLAEETGLIEPLGLWVLETACHQLAAWRRAGHDGLSLAVNLSPRQFRDERLMQRIRAVLEESGLPPERLELEITESLAMDEVERNIHTLEEMGSLGLRIAIDDFGTGYSSLSYLKRLPIHILKIDQSFVGDISRDADDAAIVSAIISMARSLGLKVVGEGAETREQIKFLKKHGCDEIQGYYYSRPLPADSLQPLLEQKSCKGGKKR